MGERRLIQHEAFHLGGSTAISADVSVGQILPRVISWMASANVAFCPGDLTPCDRGRGAVELSRPGRAAVSASTAAWTRAGSTLPDSGSQRSSKSGTSSLISPGTARVAPANLSTSFQRS